MSSCGGSVVVNQSGVVGGVKTVVVARLEDERSDVWRFVCEIAVETRQGFIHTLLIFLIVNVSFMGRLRCVLWEIYNR